MTGASENVIASWAGTVRLNKAVEALVTGARPRDERYQALDLLQSRQSSLMSAAEKPALYQRMSTNDARFLLLDKLMSGDLEAHGLCSEPSAFFDPKSLPGVASHLHFEASRYSTFHTEIDPIFWHPGWVDWCHNRLLLFRYNFSFPDREYIDILLSVDAVVLLLVPNSKIPRPPPGIKQPNKPPGPQPRLTQTQRDELCDILVASGGFLENLENFANQFLELMTRKYPKLNAYDLSTAKEIVREYYRSHGKLKSRRRSTARPSVE